MNYVKEYKGHKIEIDGPRGFLKTFLFDLYYGLYYGYPWCCLSQYLSDTIHRVPSALKREIDYDVVLHFILPPKIEYVPCDECLKKYIARSAEWPRNIKRSEIITVDYAVKN